MSTEHRTQLARGQERGTGSLIPKLLPECDIRALPIGPLEAFVLSRVDGRASDQEIGLATGLSTPEVSAILTRLALLGAVTYGTVEPAAKTSDSGPATAIAPPRTSGTSGMHARVEIRTSPSPASGTPRTSVPPISSVQASPVPDTPPSAAGPAAPSASRLTHVGPKPEYDRAELQAEADIDMARKELILDTFYSLERMSHYELLRVPLQSEKKAIKSAYFDVVATFHPDKYFGKTLGHFKPKLEKIFQRVTEAHDTLTRNKSREEYDRYLENLRATRALSGTDDTRAELDQIFAELEREARQSAERPSITAPPAPSSVAAPDPAAATRTQPSAFSNAQRAAAQAASPIPPGPPSEDSYRARPQLTPEERRRALARKLGASLPPPPSSEPKPSMSSPSAREVAVGNLRNHYESRLAQLRRDRIHRIVQQADEAIAANNLVSAANALRIAVSLAPEDTSLAQRFDEVERKAAATLADQYLEQARYDERRGYFAEAAQAYERVLRGRPGAGVYERGAHCLVEARAELKKAVDWARKAVEMAPRELAYRITLARAYARAEMEQSALAELERARTLAPSDDTIKDWIKRVKRGEV